MKRIGIALLLVSSFCWAEAPDGFEPASTNVWGASIRVSTPAAELNSE